MSIPYKKELAHKLGKKQQLVKIIILFMCKVSGAEANENA